MKKIPTLFVRQFENHKVVGISEEITPGCEEAFYSGYATIKFDGSCCAIIDGKFYKRYDCKKGKTPPEGAIACCDPDPVTGHWPHWVKVDPYNPADKWFLKARTNSSAMLQDGTYEAVGPNFQGNPHNYTDNELIKHGKFVVLDVRRDFESVREYLRDHNIEGLVFWLNGEPVCKIKRTDFGYKWPVKNKEANNV